MLPDLPTQGPVFEAVAAGRATLVVGPSFAHTVPDLDLWPWAEEIREAQPEIPGWDGLHLSSRLEMCRRVLGPASFNARLAEYLPTFEALRGQVSDAHRALLGLPCPVVVTTELDDLVAATLAELGGPFEQVSGDEWHPPRAGERRLVKLRGDLLFDAPAGEPEAWQTATLRPRLTAALRRRAARGPVLLYGFAAQDPQVTWLVEHVFGGRSQAGIWLVARQASGLWVDTWRARGVEVAGAATMADVERMAVRFTEAVCERRRASPDDSATVQTVQAKIDAQLANGIGAVAPWAALDGHAVIAVSGPARVSASLQALEAMARDGYPVPPGVAARAADILGRLGHHRRAMGALDLALSQRGTLDPTGEACLGRALVREGRYDRARLHLERALERGDAADVWGRADELAWLSRCILDRIDRLQKAKRERAVVETIAAFLSGQAARFPLVARDPGDDDALRLTAYYLNLRLGQVMILAGEMAKQSAAVYAAQAVELFARAVSLQPQKPDPYRALQPLLADDAVRWDALVAAAPAAVQRKLTTSATGTS